MYIYIYMYIHIYVYLYMRRSIAVLGHACRLPPAACLRSAGNPWQRRRLQEKRPMADRSLPIGDACKRRRLQEKRPMAPRMLVGASSV